MDQKRLFLAIAISLAILLGFQALTPHPAPKHVAPTKVASTTTQPLSSAVSKPAPVLLAPGNAVSPGTHSAAAPVPQAVPRVAISAPAVKGSISLVGARLDTLVLRDYHVTVDKDSPLVQVLEPLGTKKPYYVQFGWSAAPGEDVKLPGLDAQWTASAKELTPTQPVELNWANGQGLTFHLSFAVDDHYMFTVKQSVTNATGKPVKLFPWSRIRRDYTPETLGYYLLHEGFVGVIKDRLQELTYSKSKSEGAKNDGVAYQAEDNGGWAGITDPYWLIALVPSQQEPVVASYRHLTQDGSDRYQVDFVAQKPETIAPGATAATTGHVFAGAKVVSLLDQYEAQLHIPHFDKAVDFGWFYFLTKPIFFALDWLNSMLGNFGLAIIVFTVGVKLLFLPLANKSYKSMSKMKLLGPKIKEVRELYKDDPARVQQEMMALYKAEKVNPASGCLPMLIQIPVFFALYKDLYVTIEMRHAPFFGWIRDLSAQDPTNIFTLFGLVPWDPTHISPLLHIGILPLIMGVTMWLQQKMNPTPPDPMQAKMFQLMPVIFTFMLARFPAGLVVYWTCNNLLTIGQQWLIMRSTKLTGPRFGRRAQRTQNT